MVELELIAPQKSTRVSFALEPAHNALASLYLLNAKNSGLGSWIAQTAPQLTAEEFEKNAELCEIALTYLSGISWPSFPALLDDVETWDAERLIHHRLESLLTRAKTHAGGDLPTIEELRNSRDAYLQLLERIAEAKGKPFDREHYVEEYQKLHNPQAERDRVVDHLRTMWKRHLAREWKRTLPTLRDSVAAFESLDTDGMPIPEVFHQVTGRDIPALWEDWIDDIAEIVFIPSIHIGPYLMLIEIDETTARVITRARIPQGAAVESPALSRSELLMRLNALSDETRLHILELIAQEGELSTQDVIDRLDLSQSSASRHLNQLAATGYLVTRQHERTKYYRLNPDRIDQTFGELKQFVAQQAKKEEE